MYGCERRGERGWWGWQEGGDRDASCAVTCTFTRSEGGAGLVLAAGEGDVDVVALGELGADAVALAVEEAANRGVMM